MGRISAHSSWRTGALIGLGLTAGGMMVLTTGRLDSVGAVSLDAHLRAASDRETDERIVLIDIDDASLDLVGDWPWARRRYAQLVRALDHAGAKAIVLDIVLSDPTAPRVLHADLQNDYDAESSLSQHGSRDTDEIIFDDDELRDAMRDAGNVYLPMFGRFTAGAESPEIRIDRALAWLKETPGLTLAAMRERATDDQDSSDDDVFIRALLISRLLKQFDMTMTAGVDALAAVGVNRDAVERAWRDSKEMTARRLSEAFLARVGSNLADPVPGLWALFRRQVLGEATVDALSPDRTCLLNAFRRTIARAQVRGISMDDVDDLPLPRLYDATYPLDKFARVARGVGFVTHARGTGDGVVRALPLLVRSRDRWYSQLGFAVGLSERDLNHGSFASDAGELRLTGGGDPLTVPLDQRGHTIIAWHAPPGGGDWRSSFTHRSAGSVLHGTLAREAVEENERRIGIAMGALMAARCVETPAELARYESLVNEQWSLRRAALRNPSQAPDPSRLASLNQRVAEMQREALVWLQRMHALWRDESPQTEVERVQRDTVTELYAKLVDGDWRSRLESLNDAALAQGGVADATLRDAVAGKICIVGYTASSVADLVTAPVYPSVPGVMAHANVINMVLGNHFVTVVPVSAQVLLLGLLGAVVSLVTSRTGALISLVVAVLLTVALLVSGLWLFTHAAQHLSTLPMVVVLLCVWTVVTVHRQFTEEHVRRSVERALSQYTSPDIAFRIAQDANLRRLTPQPARVTCFFCDLEGFTRLSERLGPARTRDVLNPYLETMSAVLMAHGAVVNKFIGDGIFAFFNAPIRPCADHQARACAAALACHEALNELNANGSGEHPLRMRIGIASGEVFVGDYGSDSKLDYTCIGDCVNLASRLERGNKALGTTTLVDARTVGAGHVGGRPLGRWRVSGRDGIVELFELRAEVTDSENAGDHLALWQGVVTEFQAGRWSSCRDALRRYESATGGDSVANAYLRAVERWEAVAPPTDFDGAIDIPAT